MAKCIYKILNIVAFISDMMSQNLATFKLCLPHSICQIQMSFFEKVKSLCPKARILDTQSVTPDLQVNTPMEKLTSFFESHTHSTNINQMYFWWKRLINKIWWNSIVFALFHFLFGFPVHIFCIKLIPNRNTGYTFNKLLLSTITNWFKLQVT